MMKLFDVSKFAGSAINDTKFDETIIHYDVRQKLVKTGDSAYDFITQDEVYESEVINLNDYIQSFKDDVGLDNILKKVALTGDATLLNRATPIYGDERNIPQNNAEVDAAINAGKAAADAAGIAFTEDALKAYIDKLLAEKVGNEGKEGNE